MALRRSAPPPPPEPVITAPVSRAEPAMNALVAAAAQIQLDAGSVMRARITDEEWQREAWRHYDICGELRFATNRHAAAVSKCRLVVAEVDELGKPGKEVTDPSIAILAETVFGDPTAKAEGLRTVACQLYVSGESYIVAEGATNPKSDVWYVVAPPQIRKTGSRYKIKRPMTHGGGTREISKGKDLLIRTWMPHPRDNDVADSTTRAVLPILREIERLTLLTFSQIDSRLISAGLLLLPDGADFSGGDPDKEGGLSGLMNMVIEVATKQLQGAGTAAGLVPIMGTVPNGSANQIQHIKFETALQAEIQAKLDHAVRRLATGLDISPEELLGQGDTNHWSAWQIDETGIKLFIEPVMTRICNALTVGYLRPALQALGKDPDQYVLWFDPSPLTVRPNRFEDAIQLYDKGEVSGDELRKAGNFSDDAKPGAKDLTAWRAWQAVQLDPKLLQQEAYAKLLGLPVSAPPEPPALPAGPGPAEPLDRDGQIAEQLGLPQTESGGTPPAEEQEYALLPAAEQAVLRALEMAGARLLTGKGRSNLRGQFATVPRTELHTRVRPTDREHARALLAGAFTHVPIIAAHFSLPPADLEYILGEYCAELLVRGYAHETNLLAITLKHGGAIRG